MKFKPLSIVPYYGGKYKMAQLIAEILDYDNTNIYLEPFGGACSVLLNKQRHSQEIYLEATAGIGSLVSVLANANEGMKLIKSLLETEYSQACFEHHLAIKNEYEDPIVKTYATALKEITKRQVKQNKLKITQKNIPIKIDEMLFNIAIGKRKDFDIKSIFQDIWNELPNKQDLLDIQENINVCLTYFDSDDIALTELESDNINNEIQAYTDIYNKKRKIKIEDQEDYEAKYKEAFKIRMKDLLMRKFYNSIRVDGNDLSELDLAVSSYVVLAQGRDGMGKAWGSKKIKSPSDYYKRIMRLREVVERLDGVVVLSEQNSMNIMAILMKDTYINNERCMIYCDPPYLKQKDYYLDDDADAVKDKFSEYNPGMIYKTGWDRSDHEFFLETVQNAKCKMIISNYNDETHLYDKMLSDYNSRWKKIEYETKTSILDTGIKIRTECLWYNY